MASSTGSKLGFKLTVDGEREYKQTCDNIRQSLKVLGSELKLASAEFAGNEKSVDALRTKQEILTRQYGEHQKAVEENEKMLARLRAEENQNTNAISKFEIALNNSKTELVKTGNQLQDTEKQLSGTASEADNFGKEIKKSSEEVEKSGSSLSKFGEIIGSAGKAFAAGVATISAAAGALAVKIGKDVVNAFGELEQNLGGSEAVFGKYAETIQKAGEDAYKNLGVSQSEYLATANKMGALFQGSGVEQQKSLELTEKAMRRAADMASVMGIDTKAALDSVAGAAKGNFSMMDNLGVAMNATSIEAYALAKGLDFTWKSATDAEKAEVAMQMFFEKTEDYAGNFANEATQTISGSIGLLQSSIQSFTAGLGNSSADISTLTGNVVDAFSSVLKNVIPVIENIAAALPEALTTAFSAVGDIAPSLIDVTAGLFNNVFETIAESLPLIVDLGIQMIQSLIDGIVSNIPTITQAAATIIVSLCNGLVSMLPTILDGAVQIILGLTQGLTAAIPVLLEAIPQIITSLINAIIEGVPLIILAGIDLITSLVSALPEIVSKIVSVIPTIIDNIVSAIIIAFPQIIDAGLNLFTALVKALPEIINSIVSVIPQIIDNIITAVISALPLIVQAGVELLVALIGKLPEIITAIVGAIPQIIDGILTALVGNIDKLIQAGVDLFIALVENLPIIIVEIVKAVPKIVGGIVDSFKGLSGTIKGIGGNMIAGIWEGITGAGDWLKEKISGFFGGVVDGIKDFLGIRSPSKVFAEMGGYMAEGVGVGFGEEMKDISDDMGNTLADASDISAQAAVNALVDGISGNINKFDSAVILIVKRIAAKFSDIKNNLINIGSNIAQNISGGFSTGLNIIETTLTAFVTTITEVVSSAMTVTTEIIRTKNDGIIEIFDEYALKWFDAGASLVDSLTKGADFQKLIDKATAAIAKVNAMISGDENSVGSDPSLVPHTLNGVEGELHYAPGSHPVFYAGGKAAYEADSARRAKIADSVIINFNKPVESAAETARALKNTLKDAADALN